MPMTRATQQQRSTKVSAKEGGCSEVENGLDSEGRSGRTFTREDETETFIKVKALAKAILI